MRGMPKNTRLLVTAVACVLVVALAGCAAQSPQSANSADADANASSSDAANESAASNSMWSMEIDCAVCHVEQGASMEDSATLACEHAQVADSTCITCHNDEALLAEVHKDASADKTMPKKLKKTAVTAETCQGSGCHDVGNHVEVTADITEFTDTNGTTVNPHEVMGLTPGHADITCSDCHNVHDAPIDPTNTCVSCHHAGVYECGTCH